MASEAEAARFWSKVNKAGVTRVPRLGPCWEWTDSHATEGYGAFYSSVGRERAHRYAWSLLRGEIPSGMWVLHRCDYRACVNPDHLWLGTHDDNMADMVAKGRGRNAGLRGEAHPNKRLRGEDAFWARLAHLYAGASFRSIGDAFGVDGCTASKTCAGLSLDGTVPSNTRIREGDVLPIVAAAARGVRRSDLAAQYHVSKYAIDDLLSGRSWSRVTGIKYRGAHV